jgi:hypothetical protein
MFVALDSKIERREKRSSGLISFFSLKDLLPNVLLNLFFGRKIRQHRRLRQKQYKPEKTAGKTNLLFSKTQIIKTKRSGLDHLI